MATASVPAKNVGVSANTADVMVSAKETHRLKLYDDEQFKTVSNYLRGQKSVQSRDRSIQDHGKLGTLLGVFIPTVQNILGVTMFLRLLWIIGVGGIYQSFLMVLLCCLCTFLTSISLSAVATNLTIKTGGTYYVISRNLGPGIGASIGLLFYLGNTIATSMYVIGGVELVLIYMAPTLPQFGDPETHNTEDMLNNFRAYGSVLLFIVMIIVAFGVVIVQYAGHISLICVIMSIVCLYVGSFTQSTSTSPKFCLLGDRLLLSKTYIVNETVICNEENKWLLVERMCNKSDLPKTTQKLPFGYKRPSCKDFLMMHNVSYIAGMPGYDKNIFFDNLNPNFLLADESAKNEGGDPQLEVVQDVDTDFYVILAVFFPSVTGIFTGCNLSGDLKDPQKSLPIGTISAQLVTSFIYLSYVFMFGGTVHRAVLRDKYGQSMVGRMVTAQMTYPNEWVLLIGAFTSTFGAALQSLCSMLITSAIFRRS